MARATTTSDVFNAVAEVSRRRILEYLAGGERSVGSVARALRLSQPSASKHLAVLKEVDLVRSRREGRRVLYRTRARPLKAVHDWAATFERLWDEQLEDIKKIAEDRAKRDDADAAPDPGERKDERRRKR